MPGPAADPEIRGIRGRHEPGFTPLRDIGRGGVLLGLKWGAAAFLRGFGRMP
jgi:hypothetical protein